MIIDSQVHLADVGDGTWELAPESGIPIEQRRGVRFSRKPELNDLLGEMDRAGVDGTILVPPMASSKGARNATCIAAARSYPKRFAVMARIEVENPAHTRSTLDSWKETPEILGARVSFHTSSRNVEQLDDDRLAWFWAELEERDIPVMVYAPHRVPYLVAVARRHPGLRMVIDHLCIDIDDIVDDINDLIAPIYALAEFSNVCLKASCLPAAVTEAFPFPRLKGRVRELIVAFGAERVFWGSDLSRLPCRYEQLVRFFTDELDFLSDEERNLVLGLGIVRTLRWSANIV